MSLFKEQDDFILSAFQEQFNHDSDEESSMEIAADTNSNALRELPEDKPNAPKEEKNLDTSTGDTSLMVDLTESVEIEVDLITHQHETTSIDIITISDEETSSCCFQEQSFSLTESNIPTQSEDYDFTLNIRLDGTDFQQISTTYKTTFRDALAPIIDKLRMEGKSLVVSLKNNELSFEQSPESLSLRPGTILNAITIPFVEPEEHGKSASQSITVKLQDGQRKHGIQEFKINPKEPMIKLKELYAERHNLESTENITLCFDGDLVDDDCTPEEVDLEDDCVIDVMVS